MKIGIILGTRPEIIKMSPVIRECQKRKLNFFILHTNQHYSKNLDKIFFEELHLPQPKYNANAGSGSHGEETAKMLIKIEKIIGKEKPKIVLVEGDTNTVLAGALSAAKLNIKVGHVEAGLRSYFREMPEEINRVLTDHCSDFLFAPTKIAKDILLKEGIDRKKVFVTGNTIVDAVYQNLKLAERNGILEKLKLKQKEYFLLTVHRPENSDKKERFNGILEGMKIIFEKYSLPILYPIHPRSKKMMRHFSLKVPDGLKIISPVSYLEFLKLEKNARLIFTDSGGIQEEACILKIPCITLRDNTERPETLEVGSNILAGANPKKISWTAQRMIKKERKWNNPFGDGNAAKNILNILQNTEL